MAARTPLLGLGLGLAALLGLALAADVPRDAASSSCLGTSGECAAPTAPTARAAASEPLRDHVLLQRRVSVADVRAPVRSKNADDDDDDDDADAGGDVVSKTASPTSPIGYPGSGSVHGQGWCAVAGLPWWWHALKNCPLSEARTNIKMLTYNLFWWNLFNIHGGSNRSAGKLIAHTAGYEGYDLMAFQECDDRDRVLQDAQDEGLQGEWTALDGGRGIALMFRKDRFTQLSSGTADVGEDSTKQYYGKRSANWVRLRHSDNTVVFFINHHGPLPVSEGGGCTGSATAYNILKVIAENAHTGDAIILTGDFNAKPGCSRTRTLNRYMHRIYSGSSMGGVDHIYSNCQQSVRRHANLGKGHGEHGSDHDALTVSFRFR